MSLLTASKRQIFGATCA